jgi:hypothetical protein
LAEALSSASIALLTFLKQGLDKQLDPERLVKVGIVLFDKQLFYKDQLFTHLIEYLYYKQHPDGGWVDVEETVWSVAYLHKMPGKYQDSINRGLNWLASQRLPGAGWGRNNRDEPRIPYTSWVAIIVPELIDNDVLFWLEKACLEELKSETKLSYKLALPLLAFSKHKYMPQNPELINSLTSYLVSSQNNDGGFGPWRDHPCGSDPWCTSVAALGLLTQADSIPSVVLERSLGWLQKNQLPNGMWPYHYIDEGTAMAYWALKELLIYFKGKEQ